MTMPILLLLIGCFILAICLLAVVVEGARPTRQCPQWCDITSLHRHVEVDRA